MTNYVCSERARRARALTHRVFARSKHLDFRETLYDFNSLKTALLHVIINRWDTVQHWFDAICATGGQCEWQCFWMWFFLFESMLSINLSNFSIWHEWRRYWIRSAEPITFENRRRAHTCLLTVPLVRRTAAYDFGIDLRGCNHNILCDHWSHGVLRFHAPRTLRMVCILFSSLLWFVSRAAQPTVNGILGEFGQLVRLHKNTMSWLSKCWSQWDTANGLDWIRYYALFHRTVERRAGEKLYVRRGSIWLAITMLTVAEWCMSCSSRSQMKTFSAIPIDVRFVQFSISIYR